MQQSLAAGLFRALAVAATLWLATAASLRAGTKNWTVTTGTATTNINSGAAWGGTAPTNGDDAFMSFTRPSGNPNPGTILITNSTAAADAFFANSLSITNNSARDNVFIY